MHQTHLHHALVLHWVVNNSVCRPRRYTTLTLCAQEPDNQGATLQDIVFRRCTSLDNMGSGFQMALYGLLPDVDPPITITFQVQHKPN